MSGIFSLWIVQLHRKILCFLKAKQKRSRTPLNLKIDCQAKGKKYPFILLLHFCLARKEAKKPTKNKTKQTNKKTKNNALKVYWLFCVLFFLIERKRENKFSWESLFSFFCSLLQPWGSKVWIKTDVLPFSNKKLRITNLFSFCYHPAALIISTYYSVDIPRHSSSSY